MAKKAKRKVKSKTPDDTGEKQANVGNRFQAGQSGNPAGRPKGARVVFAEEFVKQLAAHWEIHGAATLDWLALRKKDLYAKVVIATFPKIIEIGGEIDHRVYESIDWSAIRKRSEEIKRRESETKPHLDS